MSLVWNGIKCIDYYDPVDVVPNYNETNLHAVLLPGWYLIPTGKAMTVVPPGGTEYFTG